MSPELQRVADAIAQAADGLVVAPRSPRDGYSGSHVLGALQRLARAQSQLDGAAYVEVGVFRGLTLLSVGDALHGHASSMPLFGVDNYCQFDRDGTNRQTVEAGIARCGYADVHLVDQDFEAALQSLGDQLGDRRVALYFVDGPHDYRSQLVCLLRMRPWLHDRAVVMIDDANYDHVRIATADFLHEHPEFKLVFEAYTAGHPLRGGASELDAGQRGWWNGVQILVRDPDAELEPMMPSGIEDRAMFEVEHRVRAHPLAPLAVELLDWAGRARELSLPRFVVRSRHLWTRVRTFLASHPDRAGSIWTDVADVPAARMHPQLAERTPRT